MEPPTAKRSAGDFGIPPQSFAYQITSIQPPTHLTWPSCWFLVFVSHFTTPGQQLHRNRHHDYIAWRDSTTIYDTSIDFEQNHYIAGDHRMSHSDSSIMSTNRPFLANFLAAFRAQSAFKATSAAGSQTSSQITSGARAIATKATSSSTSTPPPSSSSQNATPSANPSTTTTTSQNQQQHHHPHHRSHHHHHHHPPHHRPSPSTTRPQSHSRPPATTPTTTAAESTSPISTSPTSGPIPIVYNHDRRRRGSDSSSGSGGFRDALGHEKWYIGGRSATGEERFYRLGMVTKAGGRIGATGRVGSVDQLSL